MNMETWKIVPWCIYYEVSSEGRVRNLRTAKIIGDWADGRYRRVRLFGDGFSKRILLHRLIAQIFIPNPHNYPCINHKNGIKTDNSVTNLEWCSYSHNASHAWASGLRSGICSFKLDILQAMTIKKCLADGGVKQKDIAKYFKVDPSSISHINIGVNWGKV